MGSERPQADSFIDRVLAGDVRAAARLMRDIEDRLPSARAALGELFRHGGHAYIVGVTGAFGVGKSTLIDRLIAHVRTRGSTVGVVAIDPTSPFSAGAILGDRIRMSEHALDPGVFIRSLASRGHLGGLSQAAAGVVQVMDAMGKDIVLVETVGVGQDEIDVAGLAHTVIVVVSPEMGDDVQTSKAGVLEIADVYAVNKSDREGADRVVSLLRQMLEIRHDVATDGRATFTARAPQATPWEPPIVKVVATTDVGIGELVEVVQRHHEHLERTGLWRLREVARAKAEFVALLQDALLESALERLSTEEGSLEQIAERIANRQLDTYSLVESLAARLRSS